jgi:2-oxoisovalerate dehydrogenase E2 component (dihydrolipoyl transacylase)
VGRFVFKLPDVGEGIAEAEVVGWHVAVGSAVAEDDPLVDVMTDKATVEIPSPRAGRVLAITGGPGDKVRVGAELLVLDVENDEATLPRDEAASPGAAVAPLAAPTIPTPAASAGPLLTVAKARRTPQTSGREKIEAAVASARPTGAKPLASPAVRRRAHELGIALQFIPGTGPAASAMPTSTLTLLRGKCCGRGLATGGECPPGEDRGDQDHRPSTPNRRAHAGVQAANSPLVLCRGT